MIYHIHLLCKLFSSSLKRPELVTFPTIAIFEKARSQDVPFHIVSKVFASSKSYIPPYFFAIFSTEFVVSLFVYISGKETLDQVRLSLVVVTDRDQRGQHAHKDALDATDVGYEVQKRVVRSLHCFQAEI